MNKELRIKELQAKIKRTPAEEAELRALLDQVFAAKAANPAAPATPKPLDSAAQAEFQGAKDDYDGRVRFAREEVARIKAQMNAIKAGEDVGGVSLSDLGRALANAEANLNQIKPTGQGLPSIPQNKPAPTPAPVPVVEEKPVALTPAPLAPAEPKTAKYLMEGGETITEPEPVAEIQAELKDKKPGFSGFAEKISDLALKFGVPILEILEAVGYQRGGINKPTTLDKKYAEKMAQQEREYLAKLEADKATREEETYTKRAAGEQAFAAAQAELDRIAQKEALGMELSSRERLALMNSGAQQNVRTRSPLVPGMGE